MPDEAPVTMTTAPSSSIPRSLSWRSRADAAGRYWGHPMRPFAAALNAGNTTGHEQRHYRWIVRRHMVRSLAVVRDSVAGRRDRTLLLAPVLAGRRRAEVIGLRAGDLSLEAGTVVDAYRRRGGKAGRRELPCPAHAAIQRTLPDAGKDLP